MRELLRRKQNNQGMTLIELVVAFAILGVVAVAVSMFIITGIRSYSKANNETNVQSEAQTALNQINNMVIDAALGVNYNVVNKDVGNQWTLNDAGVGAKADNGSEIKSLAVANYKVLYVFDYDSAVVTDAETGDEAQQNSVYVLLIAYDTTEKKLYYIEKKLADPNDVNNTVAVSGLFNAGDLPNWSILAEGVEDFGVDLTEYKATNRVSIRLSLKRESQTYAASGIVTLRNLVAINELHISKIYKRIPGEVVISGISINLNCADYVVRDGDGIQLTTKTKADSGYPSQQVFAWRIYAQASASDTDNGKLIYDSLDDNYSNEYFYVDATTKVLYAKSASDESATLSGVRVNDIAFLRVYAFANREAYEALAAGTASNAYASKDVGVVFINEFSIQPDNKACIITSIAENSFAASVNGTTPDEAPVLYVNNGDRINMTSYVNGQLNSDQTSDQTVTVFWEVIDKTSNVLVTPNSCSNGVFNIAPDSSKGSFVIKAYPVSASNKVAYYRVDIDSEFSGQNLGLVSSKDTVNRGGSTQLEITINGKKLNASDYSKYTWSYAVSGMTDSTLMNQMVSITQSGLLSVDKTLNFDSSYTVTVTVTSKNDNTMVATKTITVPQVTISMNPVTYFLGNSWADVDYYDENTGSGIRAIVTGIEQGLYTLNWAVESNVYPGFGTSIPLTGTYVDWDNDAHPNTVKLHIGDRESQRLTYLRVKASIDKYATKSAIARVVTGSASLSANKAKADGTNDSRTSVERSTSNEPIAYYKAAISPQTTDGFSARDVRWYIESAKLEQSGTELAVDGQVPGLTVETMARGAQYLGVMKLDSTNAALMTTEKIVVKLHAVWGNLSSTTITENINGITFTVSADGKDTPTARYNRGQVVNLSATTAFGTDITWSVESAKVGGTTLERTESNKFSFSDPRSANTTVTIPYNLYTANANEVTVTLKGTVTNRNISDTVVITVNKVGFTVSDADVKGKTYTFTATVTGLEGDVTESIGWGLHSSQTDATAGTSKGGFTLTTDGNKATVDTANYQTRNVYLRGSLSVVNGTGTYGGDAAPVWKEVEIGLMTRSKLPDNFFDSGAASEQLYLNYRLLETQQATADEYSFTAANVTSLKDGGLYVVVGTTDALKSRDDYLQDYSGRLVTSTLGTTTNIALSYIWKFSSASNSSTPNETPGRLQNLETGRFLKLDDNTATVTSGNVNAYFFEDETTYLGDHYWRIKTATKGNRQLYCDANPNVSNPSVIKARWRWYIYEVTKKDGTPEKNILSYQNYLLVDYKEVDQAVYYRIRPFVAINSSYFRIQVNSRNYTAYVVYDTLSKKWYDMTTNRDANQLLTQNIFIIEVNDFGVTDLCDAIQRLKDDSEHNTYYMNSTNSDFSIMPVEIGDNWEYKPEISQ